MATEDPLIRKNPLVRRRTTQSLSDLLEPISPVTEAVRRASKDKPGYAVVHMPVMRTTSKDSPDLFRSSVSGFRSTVSGYSNEVDPPKVVRRNPKFGRTGFNFKERTLSIEELEEQNKKAVEWFQNARELNAKMRTVDDRDLTIAQVRRLREERDRKEAEEAAERARQAQIKEGEMNRKNKRRNSLPGGVQPNMGRRSSLPALSEGADMQLPAISKPFPLPLKPSKDAEKAASANPDPDADQDEEKPHDDEKPVDEENKVNMKNFMERFGYGVKAQAPINKFKFAAQAAQAAVKMKKTVNFAASIDAGKGESLLDRLKAAKTAQGSTKEKPADKPPSRG